MPELKTYNGGCHCGAVRYAVNLAFEKAIACNCSMCGKTGTLLAFVPATEFTLLSGEDSLTDYQFNKKKIHHLFCKVCGVKSFGRGAMPDGTPTVAINVRCLDDIDLATVPVMEYDGKNVQ